MRLTFLMILLILCMYGNSTSIDTVDTDTFQVIGDSVFLANGTSCHVDNFIDGTCEVDESWWDISYLSFWTGLLIPFVFFGFIAITVKRKINKRRTN